MYFAPQALLSCVAWLSLLGLGNAARGVAPSEILSHFAHTVGTALEPVLGNEHHKAKPTSSERSAIKPRQVSAQEAGPVGNPGTTSNVPYQNQALPFHHFAYNQFRFNPYAQQQLVPNFYPGVNGFVNQQQQQQQLPLNPRFYQQYAGNQLLAPVHPGNPKALLPNNNNVKYLPHPRPKEIEVGNTDPTTDSKSSAQQSRPFDGSDFSPFGQIGGAGVNVGGARGGLEPNLGADGRFSALDYERLRQNYYGNPSIDQQRNYFSSLNEIPFSSGPAYRPDRFSGGLNYNGAAGAQGTPGDIGSNSGIGGINNPYFGNFFQGPYQGLNYNGAGAAGEGAQFNGFDRATNLGLFAGGSAQFQGGFNPPFFPNNNGGLGGVGGAEGGGAQGVANEQDSSLRASSAKENVSETEAPEDDSPEGRENVEHQQQEEEDEQGEEEESATRVDRKDKGRFVDDDDKQQPQQRQDGEEKAAAANSGET